MPATVTVRLTGDWNEAKAVVTVMQPAFKRAARGATLALAHALRKEIVQGIRKGAPGGKKFQPLSGTTLAIRKFRGRGGKKPLIVSGGLIQSISVKEVQGGDAVFVGVLRTAAKGGVNVAEIHEQGRTFVMRFTDKARRFLLAALRSVKRKRRGRSNRGPFRRRRRRKQKQIASSGVGGIARRPDAKGQGVLVIRIPARPFIAPVAEKFNARPDVLRAAFKAELAIRLEGILSKGGGAVGTSFPGT